MMEMSAKSRKAIQAQAENLSKKWNIVSCGLLWGLAALVFVTKAEIGCLIQQFNSLLADQASRGKAAHGLDRGRFRGILQNVFGLTNAMMMDGVFRCFDKDGDGAVTVEEWIRGHAVFLRGTLDERMTYCFQVYDLNDDKYISKEEIFHMLKQSFIKQPIEEDPDEGLKEVVEITMKTMDHDHDGLLSFEDFKNR